MKMEKEYGRIWPNDYSGAVSLTFDDGRESQLKSAVPILDSYGIKATYYLCSGGSNWKERFEEWKQAYGSGHEIGNHSIKHMGSINLSGLGGRFDVSMADGVERMSLGEIENDMVLAEERLDRFFPQKERSFAYPCYADYVGSGLTRQSYVPVVAKHFIAGRNTGEFGYNRAEICDLHCLWSWRCEGLTYAQLIGLVESEITNGLWHIFTFHDIGDDRLGTGTYHFSRFIEYLYRRRSELWIAPVAAVAERVVEWRERNLKSEGGI